jgi:hypothetical protein
VRDFIFGEKVGNHCYGGVSIHYGDLVVRVIQGIDDVSELRSHVNDLSSMSLYTPPFVILWLDSNLFAFVLCER